MSILFLALSQFGYSLVTLFLPYIHSTFIYHFPNLKFLGYSSFSIRSIIVKFSISFLS
ncbi:Calreticulin [Gossypium arboreum]|uniref:Calreticulin n=1 Tax=Gossypium arboreum TaxID=29729 RepID=A0A0B0N8F5_GOSAR|nr:Calreticulin [Gossypium arboreum]